jgi:L-threonylcarbamoyladenylate synthase
MPRLELDLAIFTDSDLAPAIAWLRSGRVVAYPTDTVYGLAVDPASEIAVQELFALKGREESSALPLIAASRDQVEAWCGLSPTSRRLADAFWPGPLSVICDAPRTIASAVHAGRRTIAIRVPAHRVARALASAWGTPLVATSANRSGEPPAHRAADLAALAAANESRLLIVDAGDTAGGPPSTIVDARDARVTLVREGAIPWNRVLDSLQQR